ncbi:hypothetical protein FB451DRAFT_1168515 [Mycena latifolia]|nr:hypothetical protein FB451DRAFT_1168515 [Mycena latifolia]
MSPRHKCIPSLAIYPSSTRHHDHVVIIQICFWLPLQFSQRPARALMHNGLATHPNDAEAYFSRPFHDLLGLCGALGGLHLPSIEDGVEICVCDNRPSAEGEPKAYSDLPTVGSTAIFGSLIQQQFSTLTAGLILNEICHLHQSLFLRIDGLNFCGTGFSLPPNRTLRVWLAARESIQYVGISQLSSFVSIFVSESWFAHRFAHVMGEGLHPSGEHCTQYKRSKAASRSKTQTVRICSNSEDAKTLGGRRGRNYRWSGSLWDTPRSNPIPPPINIKGGVK